MAGNDRPNTKTFRLPVNSGITPDGFSENVPLMLTNNYVLLPDGSGIKPREGFEIRRNDAVGYGSSRKLIYFISNPPDIDYGDMLVIVNTKDGRNFNETTEVVRTTNTVASENPMPMPALPTPTPVTYAAVAGSSEQHYDATADQYLMGVTFYDTTNQNYYSHLLNFGNVNINRVTYMWRLSHDVLATWHSNFPTNTIFLYKIADIKATGPALAGGAATWEAAPRTTFWKKFDFPAETLIADMIPVSDSLALFIVDHTVYPINLVAGTLGTSYVIPAPADDDDGILDGAITYPDFWRWTADGRMASLRIYRATVPTNIFATYLCLLNPSTQSVEWIKLQQNDGGAFYNCDRIDVTSSNILVGLKAGLTGGVLARYDITNAVRLPDIALSGFAANSVSHFMAYEASLYVLRNGLASPRLNATTGAQEATYAMADDVTESTGGGPSLSIHNNAIYLFGNKRTTGKGKIYGYNLTSNAQIVNTAFVEFYGAQNFTPNGYASFFSQVAWSAYRVPDPFLTKRIEMTGA